MPENTSDKDLIEVPCANCGKKLRVERKFIGRHGRCPHCQTKFRLSEPKPEPKKEKGASDLAPEAVLAPARIDEEYDEIPSLAVVLPWWQGIVEEMKIAAPCWVISLVAHLTLLVILALVTVTAPQKEDEGIQVNVQLKAEEDKKDIYLSKQDIQKNLDQMLPERSSPFTAEVSSPAGGITTGPDVSGVVPVIGITGTARPGGGSAFAVATGPVSFFGSSGGKEVSSVIFVVDRSTSMEGEPLATAKAELIRSIQRLTVANMFNVIFFSDAGAHKACWPNAVLATTERKEECYKFIEGLSGYGGTNPKSAMELAIRARPDLIYLLTDGEFEQGKEAIREISELLIRYGGGKKIKVNTIAFRNKNCESVLRQIASQTGGQYRYER